MQCMARRFVFGRCGAAAAAELKKDQEVPDGDIAIVCMDGLDFISQEPSRFLLSASAVNHSSQGRFGLHTGEQRFYELRQEVILGRWTFGFLAELL